MKITNKTRALVLAGSCGVAAVLAAMLGSTGCELLVDFDRTLIDAGIPDVTFADVPVTTPDGTPGDSFVADGFVADGNVPPSDGSADGPKSEGGVEAGVDAGADSGVDAGIDSGVDAGEDSGVDAGIDSGIDAGIDSGIDAQVDAGFASYTFTPAAGAYGTVAVGTTTEVISYTLTNVGSVSGTPSGIVLSGPSAGDFGLNATGCASALAPNGTCTVLVSLTPADPNLREATLTANQLDGTAPVLTGTGAATGVISIDQTVGNFGSSQVGTAAGTELFFKVTNLDATNPVALTLGPTDGQNGTDFTLDTATDAGTGTACGATLLGGASCEVGVLFTPSATGPRYGNLPIVGVNAVAVTTGTVSASFVGSGT